MESIRIGILFSLSGTMEVSERGQYYSALLAIEQINRKGGIYGRKIRPFVTDSASNPYIAALEAEKLIVEHQVSAIIGLYTSATRKEVLPIIEKYDSVLFYPNGYEGEEQHPNIIYCGPLPTQNLIHFIPWLINNIGKKFYLIGSDYIYPKEMNNHINSLVLANRGKILGEEYALLGEQIFDERINRIQKLKPDIVFSTLVGDSAVSFYKQFYEAGVEIPIASLITAETEIAALNPKYTAGHFACFPYFDSIQTKENKLFLKEFKDLYNINHVSSVMENAYNSVYLLAEALKKCEIIDTPSILKNIKGIRFNAPQGEIMVDKMNQHVWLNSRIGQVNRYGGFNILWESNHYIQPIPFAKYYFSNKKNPQKSLNQLEQELQVKLTQYQPLLNELKNAIQDLKKPAVFFDKDGLLISVLNSQQTISEKLPFLITGISIWRTPLLRNSGITHSFITNTPSYTTKEEHLESLLNEWISIGIPVKDKNENLIGSLGVFIDHTNYFSIDFFMALLSKLTTYCFELSQRSDNYIFTYELLNNFSTFIDEPLFIFRNHSIVFESNSAKQLRINDYDFVIEYIKKTVSTLTTNRFSKVLHQKSSNKLFKINIAMKGNYHYVNVKTLDQNLMLNPDNTRDSFSTELIGINKQFLKSLYLTKVTARNETNVLLLGESGTGKETFARTIHHKSKRKDHPFIILNCASTPSHLMNIELFGYEEGVFPEAEKGSPGKFELAEGGTLFLDEITDMPLDLQTTFLRVLQEKTVTRVGGDKTISINVRVIAATNKNIHQEIAYKGTFRSDLYYYLNSYLIALPPLRERKDDIPYLVDYFLKKLSNESGKINKEVEKDTLHVLMDYDWPGNIRELKSIIERAFYVAESSINITSEHLPKYIFENSKEFEETLFSNEYILKNTKKKEIEKSYNKNFEELNIVDAIIKFKGNITKTAKYLGMSRTTLYRKLGEMNSKRQ